MKRIKFPLVMKNGAEVRTVVELRDNFDMESLAEYFTSGKLVRWLENNYEEEILEEIQKLNKEDSDFGEQLAKALGVEWKNEERLNLQDIMKLRDLKERLRVYVSEEELGKMEHIADTQEELERFAKEGYTPVYLFGKDFQIKSWMHDMECIGIDRPIVHIEIESRDIFRKAKLKLRNIECADKEMKKVALGDSQVGLYYGLLDVLEQYFTKIQNELG